MDIRSYLFHPIKSSILGLQFLFIFHDVTFKEDVIIDQNNFLCVKCRLNWFIMLR